MCSEKQKINLWKLSQIVLTLTIVYYFTEMTEFTKQGEVEFRVKYHAFISRANLSSIPIEIRSSRFVHDQLLEIMDSSSFVLLCFANEVRRTPRQFGPVIECNVQRHDSTFVPSLSMLICPPPTDPCLPDYSSDWKTVPSGPLPSLWSLSAKSYAIHSALFLREI